MKRFLLFVSICSITLCGFTQTVPTADGPFVVLSYSVKKLPDRSKLDTFPTSDASTSGPTAIQRQQPSDIKPALQRARGIQRLSAELQNLERNARSTGTSPSEVYQYKLKARNENWRIIERVFWQYETGDPGTSAKVTARQFLCGIRIKPHDAKEFIVTTPFAPSNVVSVSDIGRSMKGNMGGRAVVNRIEYADGTIWENPKWESARIKPRLNDEIYRSAKGRCIVL